MITLPPSYTAVCKPQITSLIDVMTILLVFLLVNFSIDGSLITPSANLELPPSLSKEKPEPMLMLELTTTSVLAEGHHIVTYTEFNRNDSLEIPQLAAWLNRKKVEERRSVMLQADRRIPFAVIKRVMYTCSKTGFDDFTILVRQEG